MDTYLIGFGVIVFLITVFRKELNSLWDWLSSKNKFGKIVEQNKTEDLK
jgi:hypothetical protein